MNCDEFVELVTAYLEGGLDPVTERRFVEHLAECVGCDRYLGQIRATVAALGHLPAESLAPRARADLLSAFRDWNAS
jgi:anti-sigma factor RsiW